MIIVGSGVGGYPAAIYLARKGLRVAVVEKHLVGGECTNYGCVPSKALYHFAESVKTIDRLGGRANYSWESIVEWIGEVVKSTREGLQGLLEEAGVDIIRGKAALKSPREVFVRDGDTEMLVETEKILLAPGTDPATIRGLEFDGHTILSNRDLFSIREKPERVLIVGGGVIGVEVANALASLKTDVTLVEIMDHILPFTDRDVALAVKSYLTSIGVKVLEKTSVEEVEKKTGGAIVKLSSGLREEFDKILVAAGRKPSTSELQLANAGVETDAKGYIKTNDRLETSAPGIYATGDAIGGPQLAHKAIVESIAAAKNMLGEKSFTIDYTSVPLTIFSGLEVATIGFTEKDLIAKGVRYTKVKAPVSYLSAVRIKGHKHAFVKMMMSEDGSKVYGIQIVSPNASEIISAYIPFYMGKMSSEEIAKTPYPHLTVSESLRDFAEFILGDSVHILARR